MLLAGGPGKDFKAMQMAAAELGIVAEQLDALEIRWLELAEMAGEL